MFEVFFPSNWTKVMAKEYLKEVESRRRFIFTSTDGHLYRGWNGKQFWFQLAFYVYV